jgi:nitrogen fixation protein FixH
VASQAFDKNKEAQMALGWDVSALVDNNELLLSIVKDGQPLAPEITTAIFGRATSVAQDQLPEFTFDGTVLRAPVEAGDGNWNLRIKAIAADGTLFQQRIIVETAS